MRENLMNRMIRLYGMENRIVVAFCEMCENLDDTEWNNMVLRLLCEAHEADPQIFTKD